MPKLIRLYIISVAIGFALSAVFLALLLGFNIAGLRNLIWGSDMRWTAILMMIVMNGVVFSGVQFAIAVMRLAEDPTGPSRGTPVWLGQPVPARVTVAAKVRKVAGPQQP